MTFKIGQIVTVINRPGHIYMVCEIEHIGEKMPADYPYDLGRYTLQEDGPDGSFYYNSPGYLMRASRET
jgi:hypothetical protein